jgi:hypothetical protein
MTQFLALDRDDNRSYNKGQKKGHIIGDKHFDYNY